MSVIKKCAKGEKYMIDVKIELEKYKPLGVDENIKYDDEISNLLYCFNKTVERIGKDQYRTLKHTDDIMEAMEEKRGFERLIEDMKNKINSMKAEEDGLLAVIMEVCDLTENMYIFSVRSQDLNLRNQMELQLKSLQQSLLKCGIIRFGNTGDIFDRQLHAVEEIRESPDFSDGQILEVIKSGYMHKNCLLKKAEVVISGTRPEII